MTSTWRCFIHTAAARRRAFTLIELLVSTAVIGVLSALVLVGVNTARTAALDESCRNNLRQIGAAIQVYHESMSSFPPGGGDARSVSNPTGKQLAWSVHLLPYLEQAALYRELNIDKAFNDPANAKAAAVVVSTYVCPRSSRTSLLNAGRAVCDYGGMRGNISATLSNPRKKGQIPVGVMVFDYDATPRPPRPIRIRRDDVKDGLDLTIILGEDSQTTEGQWINGANIFDQDERFSINAAPAGDNSLFSNHKGGAHVLFCDGRVKLLSQEMDNQVLGALCTRAEHEIVRESDF